MWPSIAGRADDVHCALALVRQPALRRHRPCNVSEAGQFIGKNVTLLSLGCAGRVLALPQPCGSGLFAGVALEVAGLGRPLGMNALALNRVGVAAYGGAVTTLGPAYVGLRIGQDGNLTLYPLLGRT
jgi:hypothetical protein